MKTIGRVGILAFAICLASCERFGTPSTSPTFEVRDFSVEGERKHYGGSVSDSITYKGRGTIIATPKGNYLVWLRGRNLTRGSEEEINAAFIADGTGVLKTAEYVNDAPQDLKPPKYKWELIGYTPILSGTLIVKE